jgi:hypothetical protein
MDIFCCNVSKKIEKKMNNYLEKMKDNPQRKDQIFMVVPYFIFFVAKEPFKKNNLQQK